MLAKKMGKIVEYSMSLTHDDESTLKSRQETPRFNAERKDSTIELLSQESVEIGSAVNNNTEETIKWKIGNDSSSDDEFFDAEGPYAYLFVMAASLYHMHPHSF